MATKSELADWVHAALTYFKGKATLLDVSKWVWQNHEADLKASGDLFYTWQYDLRWAATELRKAGKMRSTEQSQRGIWELK